MAADQEELIDLDRFLNRHTSCLRDFDHFIELDRVNIDVRVRNSAHVRGRLYCLGGAYLEVQIFLTLNEWNQGYVRRYTFHAGVKRDDDRAIFRYDNAHSYVQEGHPDRHHKHRFDLVTGEEIEPPEWVGRDRVPGICAVLAELEQWWLETGQFL